jgi:hypothetical protein
MGELDSAQTKLCSWPRPLAWLSDVRMSIDAWRIAVSLPERTNPGGVACLKAAQAPLRGLRPLWEGAWKRPTSWLQGRLGWAVCCRASRLLAGWHGGWRLVGAGAIVSRDE